ncbi:universal stress protein [Nonomuraea sp. SMC257]|uniref:Universal stress protein n=1 Tax=Nonomuraea montanisoli TaxID=2741721 RepID=A0A7Y6M2R2_9ACTN|nr:universal stress protein [Nonomuraea montanisoli]NUW31655.1 universal stress protein [Nonomuraea montanisoli]
MSGVIVAGTDGSAGAAAAVRWAADDASRRGLRLHLLHVVTPGFAGALSRAEEGERLLAEAARVAARYAGASVVTTELAEGRPDEVLRERAAGAAEVVVGSHGAGVIPGMLVGSVPLRVAGHVAGVVVVTRPRPAPGPPSGAAGVAAGRFEDPYGTGFDDPYGTGFDDPYGTGFDDPYGIGFGDLGGGQVGRIVVGAGEEWAGEAGEGCPELEFAFEQARLHGRPLLVVHAHPEHATTRRPPERGAPAGTGSGGGSLGVRTVDVAEWRGQERLADRRERYPDVTVTCEVTRCPPVPALVAASTRAALLVVGSRGLGPVGSLLLGSVSRSVLHHARCTVAVVR